MNSIKLIIRVVILFSAILAFAYFTIPNNFLPSYFIANIITLFVITLIGIFIVLRKTDNQVTSGIVFIALLFLFMFIGSLNYYLIVFIFPKYTSGMEVTQRYWIIYSLLFIIGYALTIKKQRKLKPFRKVIPVNNIFLIWLLVLAGAFGTIYGIINVGFVPLFTPGAGSKRYAGEEGMGGLATKLWVINLVAGLLSLLYYQKNKRVIYLLLYFSSIVQLSIFIIRFYFVLSILLGVILYFKDKALSRGLIMKSIIALLLLGLLNTLYLENRSGSENLLELRGGRNLNALQSRFIYSTFNEFVQLNDLIANFSKKLNGKTFLSVPISLLPSEVWNIFGISKSEIQNLNSAVILADIMDVKGGLRTGLAGELYINFGYWGVLYMVFFGAIFGYLDNTYRRTSNNDSRKIFILIFNGILIYSAFVGQINAVASMIVFYLYLFLFILIVFRRETQIITH